jgi:putative oxidoreductase
MITLVLGLWSFFLTCAMKNHNFWIRPSAYGRFGDAGVLILRFAPAFIMAFVHGWDKLVNFNEYSKEFYNFLGLGDSISLGLVIFSELICSILIIVGLFTRLATIPLIITMIVIVVDFGLGNPIHEYDTPMLYLIIFTTLMFTGAGRYSLDYKFFAKEQ